MYEIALLSLDVATVMPMTNDEPDFITVYNTSLTLRSEI